MNANSIMMTALKTAGHYIDFANNIVYVTTQFNKKAEKYGTEECRKLTDIEKMFPNITIEVSAQKRKSTAITYDMMELFMMNTARHELQHSKRSRNLIQKKARLTETAVFGAAW